MAGFADENRVPAGLLSTDNVFVVLITYIDLLPRLEISAR